MFRRLGSLVARVPLAIVVVWVAIAVAVVALTPRLSDVVNSSQATYLPSYTNSQRAQAILEKALPASYAKSTAIVVVTGAPPARRPAVTDYSNSIAHALTPPPFSVVSD